MAAGRFSKEGGRKEKRALRHKRKKFGFCREERLNNPADFSRVYRQGKRVAGKALLLYVLRSEQKMNRIGFSVGTKRAGGPLRRNRMKRQLREIYRRNKDKFAAGWDLVVVPRAGATQTDFRRLEDELLELAKKAEIIQ